MSIPHKTLYEIGPRTALWLEAIGIDTVEKLRKQSPEKIYESMLAEKKKGNIMLRNLAKPMLYALRANAHFLKTGERIPFQYWKKVRE